MREGGSIPVVATFDSLLHVPTVLLGVGLPDEHAHAPNERLNLDNFYRGMLAAAYLWHELAARLRAEGLRKCAESCWIGAVVG